MALNLLESFTFWRKTVASYQAYQLQQLNNLELKLKVFLTGYTVAMVIYFKGWPQLVNEWLGICMVALLYDHMTRMAVLIDTSLTDEKSWKILYATLIKEIPRRS